jgi:hypothetical protein
VKAARKTLLDKGWDVVVCLTDLPLHVKQRPVVAHANPVRNVAIVSVPALGAMGHATGFARRSCASLCG